MTASAERDPARGELAGQVAIVTGAGSGFGRAIAERLASEGAAVTLMGRSHEKLAAVAASIEGAGGRALAVRGDVTRSEDVTRVVSETESLFGITSLFVHSAGVRGPVGPIWANDEREWWHTQEVHVRGLVLFLGAVLPGMIAQKAGRVIAVSSAAADGAVPHFSAYSVAKGTQIRIIERLAVEAKEHGVVAFAIHPGMLVSEMAEATIASPDAQQWAPVFVERLRHAKEHRDQSIALSACTKLCLELASGRCDALSGQYLTPDDDLIGLGAR